RVDDDEVDRTAAHEHVGDLESLLPRVGLRHEQGVDVDTERFRVLGVEGVLRVDEGRDAPVALRVRNRVEGERRLTRRLRAVDLHDATARQPTDSESNVEGDRT